MLDSLKLLQMVDFLASEKEEWTVCLFAWRLPELSRSFSMIMVWERFCPGPLANWLWWDGWVITFLESDANGLLLHPVDFLTLMLRKKMKLG